MAEHIKIRKAPGTWVVRAAGAVIGESDNALELTEGDRPAVIYFPREDLAMAFLDLSGKTSHDPLIGDAVYFSIVAKSRTIDSAAWSYEDPNADAAKIAGYVAFNTTIVPVEHL